MRLLVRLEVCVIVIPRSFMGRMQRTAHPKSRMLFQLLLPISRLSNSREERLLNSTDNATRGNTLRIRVHLCCHSIPTAQLRNINLIPFQELKQSFSRRNESLLQDRLTHVQLLFTWNPTPLQSSKVSFEQLLLPPRSALRAVPCELTHHTSIQPLRPPTHHVSYLT